MLGPAAAVHPDGVAGDVEAVNVEQVLADFRDWLRDFADPSDPPPAVAPFDLHALVGQLAALRHDVSLQTKAARALTEQTVVSVASIRESVAKPAPAPVEVRPLVKAVIDVADALATAHAQVGRMMTANDSPLPPVPDELIALVNAPPSVKPVGLLGRLVGTTLAPSPDCEPIRKWLTALTLSEENRATERKVLSEKLEAVADGYAISLRRVERILPQFGLEAIVCIGRPFDPETMEAVELESGDPGMVVREVRRGYRWDGKPFRPAQVTVGR